MNVLIIGSKGNMGKRYDEILTDLGYHTVGYDIEDYNNSKPFPDCGMVIVATPTNEHHKYVKPIITIMGILKYPENVLFEKPAFSHSIEIDDCIGVMGDFKMVNNWAFVFPDKVLRPGKHHIFYDYKNTGKEGYWFDTCQLHILAKCGSTIRNNFNSFTASIDGVSVLMDDIKMSYRRMIEDWLSGGKNIWSIGQVRHELNYIVKKHKISEGKL